MKRVSLVGTVHAEAGFASVYELLAILERIKPEVIFLEIPSAAFDDYFTGTRGGLESSAVRRYREIHNVDLVPVDLPTPEPDFFKNSQDLHERIEKRSPEYCRLMDCHSQNVRAYGFAYLNSEHCSTHWSKLREAMLTAIEEVADRGLAELYELWVATNEHRDKEMMKRIGEYCRKTSFSKGAFLVGAAHRQSIIDKARGQRGAVSATIQWDLAGFLTTNLDTVR
ncbi:MAG TPA: hypothetical protein VIV88_09335 [Gemmatimonadales bacterium]|jgi:hypothetical protein